MAASPFHSLLESSMRPPHSLRRRTAGALLATTIGFTTFAVAPTAFATLEDPELDLQVDQLVVSQVGDGESGGNDAVPVSIQHIDSTGQTTAQTPIPTAGGEGQFNFSLGANRDQQGALQRSANGQLVTIGGYDFVADGSTNLNGSVSSDVTRVIASMDASGTVDVSTGLGFGFNERHIRGVTTVDGSAFWAGGHGNDTMEGRGDHGTQEMEPHQGGVLYAEAGTNDPTPVTVNPGHNNDENNARVPVIHDDQLYVTSDRDPYNGVNQIATGLPTQAIDVPNEMVTIAELPSGAETAHDFVFIDDSLYVTATEGDTAGVVRYDETAAGTYEVADIFEGEFWGLTGRQAGDDTVLYAVEGSNFGNDLVAIVDTDEDFSEADKRILSTAPTMHSYRGVAFAPGFDEGTTQVTLPDGPAATIDWDIRVSGGTGNALSAVLGADTNPEATGRITPLDDTMLGDIEVTAVSADQDIVANDDIAVEMGEDNTFTITATPTATGTTFFTVTATDGDEVIAESTMGYWVSAALPDDSALAHVGMADASTAQEAGDGHLFVADDDSNNIRLYGPTFDEPVAEFPIHQIVEQIQPGREWDLEASARADDIIYWVGSMGNSRSGNLRPDRDIIIATEVTGTGADAVLEPVGYTRGTRDALVAWDANNEHGEGAGAFEFERATAHGYGAEGPNSLNVEGATMAPDGETLWLGFRSPLTPLDDGDTALMVAIEDIEDIVIGYAEPQIADHHYLDLDGRAIRSMAATDDGNYLITAGSADDEGNFAMFGWTGDLDDEPVQAAGDAPALEGWEGSYEGTAYVESLEDGTTIRVIQDVGTLDLYNTGAEAQDLDREYAKFVSHDYVLDFDGAFAAQTPAETETPTPEPTETPAPEPTDTESSEPTPTTTAIESASPTSDSTPPTVDPDDGETPVAGGTDESTGSGLASTGATVLVWIVLGLILLAVGIAVVRHQRLTRKP